jgi:hypothetical protein
MEMFLLYLICATYVGVVSVQFLIKEEKAPAFSKAIVATIFILFSPIVIVFAGVRFVLEKIGVKFDDR